jgi:regulatory protein
MIKDLSGNNSFEKAYNYATYLLGLKLRTEGELREKMRLKKYNAEVVDSVIKQFLESKYLDDQRYAEVYLENLKAYKNFGYFAIKKKFMEKKLPAQLIESVLTEGYSIVDETLVAKRFLKKEGYEVKVKSDNSEVQYNTFNEESGKEKQKIANRLKSRGFRGEVVAKLVF